MLRLTDFDRLSSVCALLQAAGANVIVAEVIDGDPPRVQLLDPKPPILALLRDEGQDQRRSEFEGRAHYSITLSGVCVRWISSVEVTA